MKIHFASLFFALIIFALLLTPTSQYIGHTQTSNIGNPFDSTNLSKSKSVLSKNATSDQEKFTADEINAIFYNLYEDYLKSDKNTEYNHYENVSILMDIICSNNKYEDRIEACDIVTEFPYD